MGCPRPLSSLTRLLVVISTLAGLTGVCFAIPVASARAATTTYATATFGTAQSNGWGSANVGGSWTLTGTASDFDVAGGVGHSTVRKPGWSNEQVLNSVSARDVDESIGVESTTAPSGYGQLVDLVARHSTSGEYRVRVRFAADKSVRLSASRVVGGTETTFGSEVTVPGLTWSSGKWFRLRAMVTGANPTTLQAMVWPTGGTEPQKWQLTDTDSTSAVQTAGGVGVGFYVGGNAAATPTSFAVDNLSATAPTTTTQTSSATPSMGSPTVGAASFPIPSGALYVSPSGSDSNPGTLAKPLRTIAAAVTAAPSGGTIVLRAGTYHESVTFPYQKALTVQNYPGEAVWLDGSSALTGWTQSGSVWEHAYAYNFDSSTTQGGQYWDMVGSSYPMAAHPDEVFYDGSQLAQVGSLSQVSGAKFYVDTTNHKLYIGEQPSGHTVAAATLQEAMYVNGGTGSVIRGIGFRRYATSVDQYGAVKAFADNVTLESDVFADIATTAVDVQGAHVTLDHLTVTGSGDLGIGGYESDYMQLTNSVVDDNNVEHFNTAPVAGGVKLSSSRYDTVSHNEISDNNGNGLWFDDSCYQTTIVSNNIQDNTAHGIHYEISGYAIMADNLITNNGGFGIHISESNNVRIYNNTIARNERAIDVIDGPRVATDQSTPGHDPRYPNDPYVTWVVKDIVIRNNILAGFNTGAVSLLGVDDGNRKADAGQMVSADYDAYYRVNTTSPKWVADWCNYTGSPTMLVFTTFPAFQSQTGQEAHGQAVTSSSNPYFVNWNSGNFDLPQNSPARGVGVALPSDIASAIGLTTTGAVNLGMLTR